MALRERIELLIDVTTSGANRSLKSLKDDVDGADGAFGKLKAGASNVFGGMGGIIAGGVAAAGTAISGFALNAIGDFQDVALKAGEMGDKLGIPAEDASRLMEVAGDLGIEIGTLESAMGRMNLTAAKAPEKFDNIGASIARNADGTINVTETFKNAAEAIQRIPDAASRAKAAQEIFGKGWQGVAELISGGAKGITEAMASVEDAKVIDEAEVEKARKFRDMMDSLKGRFESFALIAGEVLVDAAAGFDVVIGKAETLARWLTFRDARRLIYDNVVDPVKAAGEEMEATYNDGASRLIQGLKDLGVAMPTLDMVDKALALKRALEGGAEAVAVYGPGLEGWNGHAAEMVEKALAGSAAIDELNESMANATADAAISTNKEYFKSLNGLRQIANDTEEAIADFGETINEEVDGSLKRLPLTLDQTTEAGRKQYEALEPLSDAIGVRLAEAYVQADGDQSKFMLNAKKVGDDVLGRLQKEFGLTDDEVNTLRRSLGLTAKDYEARFRLTGSEEARVKLGLLQTAIDNLPKDVQAQVTQKVVAGDYVGALQVIQDYNNRNPTEVRTNSQAGDVAAGRNAVQRYNDAHPTTVRVNSTGSGVTVNNSGSAYPIERRASGGPVSAGTPYLIGEEGPEVMVPRESGVVIPNDALAAATAARNATRRLLSDFGSYQAGPAPGAVNVTVNNYGRDLHASELARAIKRARLT